MSKNIFLRHLFYHIEKTPKNPHFLPFFGKIKALRQLFYQKNVSFAITVTDFGDLHCSFLG